MHMEEIVLDTLICFLNFIILRVSLHILFHVIMTMEKEPCHSARKVGNRIQVHPMSAVSNEITLKTGARLYGVQMTALSCGSSHVTKYITSVAI